jgi:general secretion pathway protein A
MYRSFFGLRERPFDLTPNPRFLVLTTQHREALSGLEYGIASRRGITLLLGEAGTGKTTLIRTALERQSDRVHTVHISNPALSRDEFVEMLAARFELSAGARLSKTMLLLELETLMRDRHGRGESTVLVIDEAQSIPGEILEEIRLMANIETDDAKLLSVVLAGQPEIAARLNQADLRQLKQRIALRCELKPLSTTETAGYVAGRIAAAGGVGAEVFTREAVMLIHERSGGIPRTISVIADNALLTAFALGRRPASRVIVEEVCGDLDLRAAPAADFPVEGGPPPGTEARERARGLIAVDRTATQPAAPAVEDRAPAPAKGAPGRTRRTEAADTSKVQAGAGIFSGLYSKTRRSSLFNFMRQE